MITTACSPASRHSPSLSSASAEPSPSHHSSAAGPSNTLTRTPPLPCASSRARPRLWRMLRTLLRYRLLFLGRQQVFPAFLRGSIFLTVSPSAVPPNLTSSGRWITEITPGPASSKAAVYSCPSICTRRRVEESAALHINRPSGGGTVPILPGRVYALKSCTTSTTQASRGKTLRIGHEFRMPIQPRPSGYRSSKIARERSTGLWLRFARPTLYPLPLR